MAVEAVTKAGGFTDEILAKNFVAISKEFNNVAQWQRHAEEHLVELYDFVHKAGQMAQAAAKPKGMKTKHKVIIGVAIGIYVGRKMMTREFNEKLEKVKAQAQEQASRATAAVKDSNFLGDPPSER